MDYRIALGTSDAAEVVGYSADVSLSVGDQIEVSGVDYAIYELAPFEPGRQVDYNAVAIPGLPILLSLNNEPRVELYGGEVAKIRRQVKKQLDTGGKPAAEALRVLEQRLEEWNAPPENVSDDALRVIALALCAMDVSDDSTDRLRDVRKQILDYLEFRPC
jgi:hypothetical protein